MLTSHQNSSIHKSSHCSKYPPLDTYRILIVPGYVLDITKYPGGYDIADFYKFHKVVSSLPLDFCPIGSRQVGQYIWTCCPLNLSLEVTTEDPHSGHLVVSTLCDDDHEQIILVSGHSVYLES